jgi:hypothetical protein
MITLSKKFLAMAIPLGLFLVGQACNFSTTTETPSAMTQPADGATAASTSGDGSPTDQNAQPSAADNTPNPTKTPTMAATPTSAATPTPQPIVYPLGPANFPANVNPLTGLAVSDPSILMRRPIAVKVSNFPRNARPQAGMSKADILFEWYTEHGDTRFMALFYGQDAEKVGPIRSVRIQDFSFVPLFDSILVHVAGYGPVIDRMNLLGIDAVQELGAGSMGALWRDDDTVNGVFANTAKMTQYVKHIELDPGTQPKLDGMAFNPEPYAGDPASIGILMNFSSAAHGEWKYDTAKQRYLRYSEDEANRMVPLLDRTTHEQLAVDNLVVLFDYWTRCFVQTIGNKGQTVIVDNELWEFNFQGSGQAFFFRDGKMQIGQWKSNGNHAPLQFLDKNGKTYFLHPGSTYITVIPAPKSTDITLDGNLFGRFATTEYQFNGNPGILVINNYGIKKPIVENDTRPC